jgi:hypothetical protein
MLATFSVSAVTSSLLAESELVKKIACKIARYVLLSTIKNDFTLTHVPFNAFRSTRALRGTRHFDNGILWMPGTEFTYSSTCRLFRLTLDANIHRPLIHSLIHLNTFAVSSNLGVSLD